MDESEYDLVYDFSLFDDSPSPELLQLEAELMHEDTHGVNVNPYSSYPHHNKLLPTDNYNPIAFVFVYMNKRGVLTLTEVLEIHDNNSCDGDLVFMMLRHITARMDAPIDMRLLQWFRTKGFSHSVMNAMHLFQGCALSNIYQLIVKDHS